MSKDYTQRQEYISSRSKAVRVEYNGGANQVWRVRRFDGEMIGYFANQQLAARYICASPFLW